MTNHRPPRPSLRVRYHVIRITNATPKQKPEATRLTMSAPCKAATRSLPRLDASAMNPKVVGAKAIRGDNVFILPPWAGIRNHPATHFYCGSEAVLVSGGACR
jgi:hypothetical protein